LTLTSRGKAVAAIAGVLGLGGAGVGALALTGNAPAPLQRVVDTVTGREEAATCPLTGETLPEGEEAPARPVLAVKVENTPDAQPLAGLDRADIVYEEVVEGGITRFVVLFHCGDAQRVGPVRSARTTDPKILDQFSEHPPVAFSGGAPRVLRFVDDAGLTTLTEDSATSAFERDEARASPHDLFTNTRALYRAARKAAKNEPAPRAVFVYDETVPKPNRPVRSAKVVFSSLATAEWRWEGGRWVRYVDGAPMELEDGSAIAADNVVIQQVRVSESDIVDVAGYPSPEVELVGEGKAWILRDGKLIVGRWERAGEGELTIFRTRRGDEIALTPGQTFVELAPTGMFDSTVAFRK
jgi:DUF3048 family protein